MRLKIRLLFCIIFISMGSGTGGWFTHIHNKSFEDQISSVLQDSFIWIRSQDVKTQQYVAFRKSFYLEDAATKAYLRIFADNRFILWINGQYVERGP